MGIELKDEARQHEEDLERIADFRLMDDDYMTAFFNQYPEGVENTEIKGQIQKVMEDGQIIILKDGKRFTTTGIILL